MISSMCGPGKDSRAKQTTPDEQSSVRGEDHRRVGRLHEVWSSAVLPAGQGPMNCPHGRTSKASSLEKRLSGQQAVPIKQSQKTSQIWRQPISIIGEGDGSWRKERPAIV